MRDPIEWLRYPCTPLPIDSYTSFADAQKVSIADTTALALVQRLHPMSTKRTTETNRKSYFLAWNVSLKTQWPSFPIGTL